MTGAMRGAAAASERLAVMDLWYRSAGGRLHPTALAVSAVLISTTSSVSSL